MEKYKHRRMSGCLSQVIAIDISFLKQQLIMIDCIHALIDCVSNWLIAIGVTFIFCPVGLRKDLNLSPMMVANQLSLLPRMDWHQKNREENTELLAKKYFVDCVKHISQTWQNEKRE